MSACRRVLALGAVLALLLLTAPRPESAVALLLQAPTATDPTRPLVAAVALMAWTLVTWSVLVLVVVLAAHAPGRTGRTAAAIGRRIAPSAVRRALEVALGVSVTVGALSVPATAAVAAGPAVAARSGPADSGGASAAAPALPSLDWPVLDEAGPPQAPLAPSSATAPPTVTPRAAPLADAPTDALDQGAPADAPAETGPSTTPPAGVPPVASLPVDTRTGGPAPATAPPVQRVTESLGGSTPVVVARGDSLWGLAEAHLARSGSTAPTDRQVAAAWPQWWSANRDAVGDDPDLIHPGTVLRPPPP